MRRSVRLAVALSLPAVVGMFWALSCASTGNAAVPARGVRPLAERLEEVIQSDALRASRVSALVVRESDGQVLFAHHPDRPMKPASNMKILTAIATLDQFGPTHRFETLALSPRPPDAKGAIETLFVRGGGDPVLNSEDWWRFSADLAMRGLRRVSGDLVLDDSLFDLQRWHPNWGRTSSRAYHGPVGALTANYGQFAVVVGPGLRPGDPVSVIVDPPVPYLPIDNQAVTIPAAGRGKTALVVDRAAGHGVELVTVTGSLRAGSPAKTYYRSVLDPTRYAGAVLRLQLAALGIRVDGSVRVGRAPTREQGYELLAFKGRPLAEIVRLFMKFSNNPIAETLVKQMGVAAGGAPGSWQMGVPAVRARLEALGLLGQGTVLVDGSGLSYDNRVSPRTLVEALRVAGSSFKFGSELVSALPIAAEDGTLEKRAGSSIGEVRAKTGLLNGVTSLSGYARMANGDRAVFSLLVNGYRVTDQLAIDAVDRFAAELVRPEGVLLPAGIAR